ncbi:MAG: protein kinase [Prevotellaceae bacterium]|jgi:serine/threonine protein kinase|nr:protein kinase [Prevotellaceae bacterium]
MAIVNVNDKTLRPTVKSDKTFRPSAQEQTIRPSEGADKTVRPSAGFDATLRARQQQEIAAITRQWEPEYTMKGHTYRVIAPISDGTGEAQILLVRHVGTQTEYVLKLYYVGIEPPPNHEILEIIRQTPRSGLLVDIYDHGHWENPAIHGEYRDYEIMTYCKGGSLDTISLRGNEEKLREIALQAASAIDFCHQHGFIHRDIKPGNLFYLDDARTHIVLGDFGISVECDADGVARTDQARTRIYAAPEMYYTVPGENRVEIDTKSDYYSLGMVLLCLWMGEKEFKEKEFELMKRKRSGDLPFPDDLSGAMLKLIKALTVPQPEMRCGFNEIVRWAQGEEIFSDTLGQEAELSFSIIFNAGKNQIAHSPEELAEFMRKDQSLAIKYLYTGKLTQWLNENARPELAAELEEIVENRYPKDQTAGIYAACYMLHADMPYYDIKGRACTTAEEIAQALSDNFHLYQTALRNANDPLFLFLNAHDLKRLTDDSTPLFHEAGRQREALRRLIYTLHPVRPYELVDDKGKTGHCKTPEEIIRFVYQRGLSAESWNDLTEESFLIWLTAYDKGLVGKIRTQLKGCDAPEDAAITYCVLYNLSPKVSFTLQQDETADDYYFTHTQIADYINAQLMVYRYGSKDDTDYKYAAYLLGMLSNLKGSRLYFYLKSKGVYEEKIEWIDYCFELQSKDNTRKAGPYNWIIATFKTVKGLGIQPYYYFADSKRSITSLEELKALPSKEVKRELEEGYLKDWLTIFFQEDPGKNFSKKYSYEQETVNYLRFIERADAKDVDVSNYHVAADYVNRNLRKVRFRCTTLIVMRLFLGVLALVPLLGFAAMLFYLGLPFTENPLGFPYLGAPMSTLNIVEASVLAVILSLLIFVTSDNRNLLGSFFFGVLLAALIYCGLFFLFDQLMPHAHQVLGGVLLLLSISLVKSCYFNLPVGRKAHLHLLKPGFEETQLEPLHFAFRADEGANFVSSIANETAEYADYLKSSIRRFLYRAVFSLIVVGFLGFLFTDYLKSSNLVALFGSDERVEQLVGRWKGTFDGRETILNITEASTGQAGIRATIHVPYSTLTNEALTGTYNAVTGTLRLDDVADNSVLDGYYLCTFAGDETEVLEGVYENYTTKKQVTFSFRKQPAADTTDVK